MSKVRYVIVLKWLFYLLLEAAKARKPKRWSKDVRNCEAVGPIMLNPDKAPAEDVITAA
jgi:putative transposase